MSETICISVDSKTAQAYAKASNEDRQRIQLLLALRLRELALSPKGSLAELMDEVSRNAEARGLTPAVLESLLNGN